MDFPQDVAQRHQLVGADIFTKRLMQVSQMNVVHEFFHVGFGHARSSGKAGKRFSAEIPPQNISVAENEFRPENLRVRDRKRE